MPKRNVDTFYNKTNYKNYHELMAASGLPYQVIETNYTTKFIQGSFYAYLKQSKLNTKTFIAFDKIRKDISNRGLISPDINRDELSYFHFSIPRSLKKSKTTIYNVDIKSAYATVLKNNNIISNNTFNEMSKLPKPSRLACVGLLASKSHTFNYSGGYDLDIENGFEKKESITSGFFFLCVKVVSDMMHEIKEILGSDYLFFWVDGIYFRTEENKNLVFEYLKNKGYNYSFDELVDFTVIEKKDKYTMFFKKYSNDKMIYDEKRFRIPKTNNREVMEVLKTLGLY